MIDAKEKFSYKSNIEKSIIFDERSVALTVSLHIG